MTFKRNIPEDQDRTVEVMTAVPYDRRRSRNWLGHTRGAALIDAMLLVGATMEQLKAGERAAVDEHLHHLKVEHGLKILCVNGKYRFGNPKS